MAAPNILQDALVKHVSGGVNIYYFDDTVSILPLVEENLITTLDDFAQIDQTPLLCEFLDEHPQREQFAKRLGVYVHAQSKSDELTASFHDFLHRERGTAGHVFDRQTFVIWTKARLIELIKKDGPQAPFALSLNQNGLLANYNLDGRTIDSGKLLYRIDIVIVDPKAKNLAANVRERMAFFPSSETVFAKANAGVKALNALRSFALSELKKSYRFHEDAEWFAEGVANYVAYLIVAQNLGSRDAEMAYNTYFSTASTDSPRDRTAPLATYRETPLGQVRLQLDLVLRANAVVFNMTKKRGEKFLHEFLGRIVATCNREIDDATLRRIYQEMTKEEMTDLPGFTHSS